MVQKEILLKEINKNNGIISTKQVLKLGSQIWILFFYIFYFLIYYDYRRINKPDLKVMTKKKYFNCLGKGQARTIKFFWKINHLSLLLWCI